MNILKKYYNTCSKILKDDLTFIPSVELTNAKTYLGQITKKLRNEEEIITIQLSKYSLGGDFAIEKEDIEQIISTICHEFAHLTYWNHETEFKMLMNKYIKKVMDNKNLLPYNELL